MSYETRNYVWREQSFICFRHATRVPRAQGIMSSVVPRDRQYPTGTELNKNTKGNGDGECASVSTFFLFRSSLLTTTNILSNKKSVFILFFHVSLLSVSSHLASEVFFTFFAPFGPFLLFYLFSLTPLLKLDLLWHSFSVFWYLSRISFNVLLKMLFVVFILVCCKFILSIFVSSFLLCVHKI